MSASSSVARAVAAIPTSRRARCTCGDGVVVRPAPGAVRRWTGRGERGVVIGASGSAAVGPWADGAVSGAFEVGSSVVGRVVGALTVAVAGAPTVAPTVAATGRRAEADADADAGARRARGTVAVREAVRGAVEPDRLITRAARPN